MKTILLLIALVLGVASPALAAETQPRPAKVQKAKRAKPPNVVKWGEDEGPPDGLKGMERQRWMDQRVKTAERQRKARRLRIRYARSRVDGC